LSKLDRLQRLELLGAAPAQGPGPSVAIRLDEPESPLDWPEDLKAAWLEAYRQVAWHRRPPGHLDLRRAIAAEAGLGPDAVALGAGAEAVLAAVLMAWAFRGTVVYPVPTTPLYARVAQALGITPVAVMLRADFSLPVEQVVAVARQQQASVVVIGSPNDPTGTLVARDEILTIVRETDALVVVDESHIEFSGLSIADAVPDHENLAVLRGLGNAWRSASFRLAWLLAHPRVVEELAKVPLGEAVGAPALLAGAFGLAHRDRLAPALDGVARDREALRAALAGVHGVVTWPSVANFLLVGTTLEGDDLAQRLLDRGIAVRPFDRSPLKNCVRVTVGTPAENAALVAAMTEVLGAVT
jgi:histidinol-phosphate aminotransferase